MKFKSIDDNHERAKVFGGWIVKTHESVYHDMSNEGGGMQEGWDWRVAMVFVPDPNHEWEIEAYDK